MCGVSHLCLVLPHVYRTSNACRDLEFKSFSWLWWVAQFRKLLIWNPWHQAECVRGRWKPETTETVKSLQEGRVLHSSFVASGLDLHLCTWEDPSLPELCWIELRVMELTMLCIWGEGCSVFWLKWEHVKHRRHSSVKRTHVLEAFSGLKMCSQPCWY